MAVVLVFVSGAAGGIGRAIVERLVADGTSRPAGRRRRGARRGAGAVLGG